MRALIRVSAMILLAVFSGNGISMAGDCCVGPRVIDGVNMPTSAFPSVGQVGDARNGYYCSATLIAPRFVLSAAHCVVDGRSGKLSFTQTDGRFLLGGVTYKAVRVFVHPTYVGDISQETEFNVDLAIFELEADVPGGVISPLFRDEPTPTTVLTIVGFGEQGTGAKGTDGTFPAAGTLNVGKAPIDIVSNTFLKWTFDKRDAPNNESNTAPGDSGGPQFITIGDQLFLASVTSGGNKTNAGFGDLSYNTRVDIAAAWIDSITGGQSVPGNNPPVLESLIADSSNPLPATEVTFTAAVNDPDNDALQFHWFFGDGTENLNGLAIQPHTYMVDGTYLVQLVVTDGKGGSTSQEMVLKVGQGVFVVPIVPAFVTKKKFSLNFSNPSRDSIEFTMLSPDFMYPSRNDLNSFVNGTTVKVFIDRFQIDALTFINGRPFGLGSLKLNYRSGTAAYSLRNNSRLATILNLFGAENADVVRDVQVPLRIQIKNNRYGVDSNFSYIGKKNKTGVGK